MKRSVLALVIAMMLLGFPVVSAHARSSTQVIVSVTGASTADGPAGFWLWSQPGGNAYGNDGSGSMYFYALSPKTQPADVSNVVVSGSGVGASVWESVTAPRVGWSCTLYATETSPGRGTVTFWCSNPSLGSTTTSGQVNISPN
jgi:hypothetical protein